ncbi:3'(2'),5'-bisphosphate nucleotidase [Aquirhabdus parva]|uniref:3'(2'),5'-bisphosphate nucleotidase CysQ n=2 Tax=Aquirhabdus parva TaxID=2283318 RepID=A0A345P573_9GAMM|nr:3'(2'),5'-bisphosphate nucleotidase [Aquirhabdus parva]
MVHFMTLNQQSILPSTLPKLDLENLLDAVVSITQEAGELLTVFYNQHLQSAIDVQRKDDTSPVTAADIAAHDLIEAALLKLIPEIPVLSEESADVSERNEWSRFWLVDPLDGTREFINKTGEFTVNIALVEAGHVVLGVIGVPLKQQVYAAIHDLNPENPIKHAYRIDADKSRHVLHNRQVDGQYLNTAMSRKSKRPQYAEYQEQLLQAGLQLNIVNAGSAYKFCLMADGSIDLYPRLHPTSEWDTAAGQCLLEVLGGGIVDLVGKPFRYNQRDHLLNGSFIAVADLSLLPAVLPKAFVHFEE